MLVCQIAQLLVPVGALGKAAAKECQRLSHMLRPVISGLNSITRKLTVTSYGPT
jgi:hypothetical protein